MPRKAMVAGVFLFGLLLGGCEWCGNCKGLAGKPPSSFQTSTPPRTSGMTAGNPIIYNNLQTPSSLAANPSGNRTTTTATAEPKGGIVPTSGSADPSFTRKPNESWSGPSGPPAYTKPDRGPITDSEVPPPEDPETRTPAPEASPSLQRPSRPSFPDTRPNYE